MRHRRTLPTFRTAFHGRRDRGQKARGRRSHDPGKGAPVYEEHQNRHHQVDRERVAQALANPAAAQSGLHFAHGGFEVPLPAALANSQVHAIRAFNVLRQYQEHEVAAAWEMMTSRLVDNGLLIDGTCDEIGRISTWVEIGRAHV